MILLKGHHAALQIVNWLSQLKTPRVFESFYSGNSEGVQNIKSQKFIVWSDAGTVVQFLVVLQFFS